MLEIATARYKEHVGPGEDFQAGYRSIDAINKWKALDPLITDTALTNELTPELTKEIAAAVAFAEASPNPDIHDLLTDI